MRTRDWKARAEEFEEDYDEARDQAFNDELRDMLDPAVLWTKDDIQGFLDAFTFPEVGDWCFDQVQSELDDIGDAKYQEWKDAEQD